MTPDPVPDAPMLGAPMIVRLDRAAGEAINAYNAGGQCHLPGSARCVACFAERIMEAAARYRLDAEVLLRHAVLAIADRADR